MSRKPSIVAVLFAAVCCRPAHGQAEATVLYIELENVVEYQVDTTDLSKWGTNPNITQGSIGKGGVGCAGVPIVGYGDIVSVNGQPARGAWAARGMAVCLSTNPVAGIYTIADTTWPSKRDETFEILQSDGVTKVGTIMTTGLSSGSPAPPGPPVGNRDCAIVGGTGAYVGARGQEGTRSSLLATGNIPERAASIMEDPSRRRQNGGGHLLYVLYLIPMERPEIVTASGSSAVFHADFSPVTAAKPAKTGEVLILQATGLGPTVPGVNPGQPFPTDTIVQVNSPVAVTVNGQNAEVINSIGWPGRLNTYRVDFRVPDGTTAGTAAIQLTAAWIAGSAVSIPIQ